ARAVSSDITQHTVILACAETSATAPSRGQPVEPARISIFGRTRMPIACHDRVDIVTVGWHLNPPRGPVPAVVFQNSIDRVGQMGGIRAARASVEADKE